MPPRVLQRQASGAVAEHVEGARVGVAMIHEVHQLHGAALDELVENILPLEGVSQPQHDRLDGRHHWSAIWKRAHRSIQQFFLVGGPFLREILPDEELL